MKPAKLTTIALAILMVCLSRPAVAADEPCTRALIISTQSVDAKGAYAPNMTDWTSRFVKVLTDKAKVPAQNIRVLAEKADPKATPAVVTGTLENVRIAFQQLSKELRAKDQFILFIVGHGTVTEPVGKLCLPGEDLKATTLADLLDDLPTRRIVVFNCASGGAEFLEKYSSLRRVVVSACGTTGQGNQSYFAEFLLLAFEGKKADANKDGVITVLEAFNRAAHQCINWYHRQYKVPKEKGEPQLPREVIVRTKEARRIFKKFYGGIKDVVMLEPESYNEETEDQEPARGEIEMLSLRRESGEHASLEDLGENSGTVHWRNNKHNPIEGKPGEQGEVAARTVLGNPKLLPRAR